MDSHLIAGAYSQQFQALKTEENLIDSDRLESIAKSKRLSQETNKRRKLQAHKRKLQAKREEKRRLEILTKRREEQWLATEKYQRSHIPPSARQRYTYVQRRTDGPTLDNALHLIRGITYYNRPMSSRERVFTSDEDKDDIETACNRPRPHSTRPGSSRLIQQLDPRERAELMNNSKQNMAASKTLFEQLLDQQQNLLLEQQQRSLQEFNNAVSSEIEGKKTFKKSVNDQFADSDAHVTEENIIDSESCSSLDSLDDSKVKNQDYARPFKPTLAQPKQRPVSAPRGSRNISQNICQDMLSSPQQQPNIQHQQGLMDPPNEHKIQSYPQSQKIKSLYENQKISSPKAENGLTVDYTKAESQTNSFYNGMASYSGLLRKNDMLINGNNKVSLEQNLKQFSVDSLESCSSGSSISVVKLQGVAGETFRTDYNTQPQGINGNKVCIPNLNISHVNEKVGSTIGTSKQQYSENFISGQQFGISTVANSSIIPREFGQMAWISSPSNTAIRAFTGLDNLGNDNKLTDDSFQPQSALGLPISPDCSDLGQMPASVASTVSNPKCSDDDILISGTAATTFPSSLPNKPVSNTITYSENGFTVDSVTNTTDNKSSTVSVASATAVTNPVVTSDIVYLDKHDLTYPQNQDTPNFRNIHPDPYQKQVQIVSANQVYNYQPQITLSSSHIIQGNIESGSASNKQMNMQASPVQHFPSHESQVPIYPQHQGQSAEVNFFMHHNPYHYEEQLNSHVLTSTVYPYPVTRNFPTSRPPSPALNTTAVMQQFHRPVLQTGSQLAGPVVEHEVSKITTSETSAPLGAKEQTHDSTKNYVEEEVIFDEDSDEMRPLKGILKQVTVKNSHQSQGKTIVGKANLRDSLELAHTQNVKKSQKKSVRFASHHIEEDGNESDDIEHTDKWNFTNAGGTSYKNILNRPLSAKFASMTTKPETSMRVQRALSAGAQRQQPEMSEHIQIRNVQQMKSSAPGNAAEGSNATYNNILGPRSNLPSSFVSPLNTTLIHRPKAAAHIIMSTDVHKETSKEHDSTQMGPSTVYKTQLETKIRSVNNNFMSKVPVKIPTGKEQAAVYNVVHAYAEGNLNGNTSTFGTHSTPEDNVNKEPRENQQTQNVDKSKNVYSAYKRVPFSSSNVIKNNVVPASTKVTYPQSSGDAAPFSTKAGKASYNEAGIRIDRTPTDDEITWLWDKVRNCLNREGGDKSQISANGNIDQGPRHTPTLSTKLIDGTTLGFGANQNGASGAMNSLRPGSGFFYPQTAPATTTQNSVKPVLQPQSSYLRRYGLLKQRRANSASAIRNNVGLENQRAGNMGYGRNSTIQPHQPSPATGQPQLRDIPTSMTFGYKPQDEVSESTAAFLMAERLAKQSLSDSHIHTAMEDAQGKQEAYNRSMMTVARRNGHSNLSIEEQKLLESLDRLNEKLKEPSFKGTIHYHQPTQAQLPSFEGHKPILDTRRQMFMSPGTHQRAQSARMRQQTHHYR